MSTEFIVRISGFANSTIPFQVVKVHKITKTRVYYQERTFRSSSVTPEGMGEWSRVIWKANTLFLPTLFTEEEEAQLACSKAVNGYAGMISTIQKDMAEMKDKLTEIYAIRRQLVTESELGTQIDLGEE